MAKTEQVISFALISGYGEKRLKKLLTPIKAVLTQKKLWWENEKEFKPKELAKYLRTANLPKKIADELYIVGTLSRTDYNSFVMDEFLNVETLPTSELQAALQLWNKSEETCKSIIVRQEALRGRKYNYYRPKEKLGSTLIVPTNEIIEEKRQEMSKWFSKNNKGTYTLILCHEADNWLYFSIFHGGLIRRENDVNSGEVNVVTYRPELSDFARINKATGVLGIHLSVRNASIEEFYVKVFNEMFVPESKYIRRDCYVLSPLKDTENIEIAGNITDRITYFSLKKVYLEYKKNEVVIKGDNLVELWKLWNLKLGMFKKADFDITFNGEENAKKLTIIPPFSVDFPERFDDEDINDFLTEHGFLIEEKEPEPQPIQSKIL